jgi:hypothetical protein
MKRFLPLLTLISLAGLDARAEDLNINEKPDTVRVSLSPYSLGVGAGAIAALNPELKNESEMFMKVSVIQSIALNDLFNVGLDLDWLFPGANWGGTLNLDYTAPMQHFKPFIGVGAGMSFFDKNDQAFGKGFGPSVTVHAGLLMDIMDELQLRVRVPFTVVADHDGDRTVGVDIGLLFSSPHRNTKVKKLVY